MANNIVYAGTIDPDAALCLSLAGITDPDSSYTIKRPGNSEIMVFQYITTGRGVCQTGNKKFYPEAGDFFVAPSHKAHLYYPDPKEPWGKVWINVAGNLAEELLRVYGISEHYYFPGCHEAGDIVAQAVEEIPDVDPKEMNDYISIKVLEIVMVLARFARRKQSRTQSHNDAAMKLRDFLRGRITESPPGLQEMSRKIGLSPVQTIRVFRQEFGSTPYAYLLNEKIDLAAEMLANAESSIKEIAELLGFSNEYYFSRIFKQKKGVPPGTYRRNAHSWDSEEK